jgi:hypothetical protein
MACGLLATSFQTSKFAIPESAKREAVVGSSYFWQFGVERAADSVSYRTNHLDSGARLRDEHTQVEAGPIDGGTVSELAATAAGAVPK